MEQLNHTRLDPLTSPIVFQAQPQTPVRKLSTTQGCSSLLTSHGHHVTIAPSHATCPPCQWSLSLWTWDLRVPTLFSFQSISILLHANALLIVPQCPHTYLFLIRLRGCMCPYALFASPSPHPMQTAALAQMPHGLCPDSLLVPVTLWFYSL